MSYHLTMKNIKKYLFECIMIVGSVLLSFYIDSIIDSKNKLELKNSILFELKTAIEEDLIQLNNVIEIQKNILSTNQILIDDFLAENKIKKKILAESFSKLKQFGPLSFFIQRGPYSQLIETGSFELIKDRDLKKNLLFAYDNYNKRKEFGDVLLDTFSLNFGRDLSPYIVISESIKNEESIFYSSRTVDKYQISSDYYDSPIVLYYYSEYKFWIEGFIEIHEVYLRKLYELEDQINKEIDS